MIGVPYSGSVTNTVVEAERSAMLDFYSKMSDSSLVNVINMYQSYGMFDDEQSRLASLVWRRRNENKGYDGGVSG